MAKKDRCLIGIGTANAINQLIWRVVSGSKSKHGRPRFYCPGCGHLVITNQEGSRAVAYFKHPPGIRNCGYYN